MSTQIEVMEHHSPTLILSVVYLLGLLSIAGLASIVYLSRNSTDPVLVEAAVKMIQTDPSSAIAAMNLLHADGHVVAIVAGITGTTVGFLGGMLSNATSRK